jgi:hypothetical protein
LIQSLCDLSLVVLAAIAVWHGVNNVTSGAFASSDPEVAIVEPVRRAALSAFDDFAQNLEVASRGTVAAWISS